MIRVLVLPRADSDIDEAADAYARAAGLELAIRFQQAIQRTLVELAEFPERGAVFRTRSALLAGIRCCRVASPFEVYRVFYRLRIDSVVVVRVIHAARDQERTLVD